MMTFFLLIILVYLGNKAIKNPSSFIIIITLSYVTLTLFQIGKNLYIVSILSVVVLCLIVRRWRESRTVFVNFPFKFAFVLCLSSYLLSYVLHGVITPAIIPSFIYDIKEYVFVVMAWMVTYKNADKNFFKSFMVAYMFILCIYGLNEALNGDNIYIDYLQARGELGDDLYENDNIIRTGFHRTKSLTIWCESYGMICSISLFVILNYILKKQLNFSLYWGVLICLLIFGVYSTNSRTCLVTMVIMLLSLLLYFKSNKKGIFVVFVLFSLGIYYSYEALGNVIDSIININDTTGSSLDMRLYQLISTLSYISSDYVFGAGPTAVGSAMDSDNDIYGAESVIFTTLLRRGFWGLFTLFFLWINILLYILKKKDYWLLPLVIGFYFLKTATLLYGVGESYILLFVFLLMGFSNLETDNLETEKQVINNQIIDNNRIRINNENSLV